MILPIYPVDPPITIHNQHSAHTQAETRAHVDDPPHPASSLLGPLFQQGYQLLTQRKHPLHVQGHQLRKRLIGISLQGFSPRRSRIIDEDVERFFPLGEFVGESDAFVVFAQVGDDGDASTLA